jgi:hypothetical protein
MPCTICNSERAGRCGACYDRLRQAVDGALGESERYREQLTALQTTLRRPPARGRGDEDREPWQRDLAAAMAAILEPAVSGRHEGECSQDAACCEQCYELIETAVERALRACRHQEPATADDLLHAFVEEEAARRQAGDHPSHPDSGPGRYYRSHFADDL